MAVGVYPNPYGYGPNGVPNTAPAPASASAPASGGTMDNTGAPPAPNLTFTPNLLGGFLPNGVPQPGASGVTQAPTINPSQVTTQQVNAPTSAGPSTVGTNNVTAAQSGVDLSNPQLASQILQGLNPQFGQQNQALQEQLANSGIMGGSSIGAQNALNMQQQSQFTSALAPLLLQQEGMNLSQSQGNQTALNQVGEFNSGNALTASQANAQLGLQNNQFNAGQGLTASEQNANDWLQMSGQNASNNLTGQEQNATNDLNAGEYNAGAQNQMNQFNTSNTLNTAQNQAQMALQQQQMQDQLQNSDWMTQYQDWAQLNQAQAGSQATQQLPYYNPPQVNIQVPNIPSIPGKSS